MHILLVVNVNLFIFSVTGIILTSLFNCPFVLDNAFEGFG